MGSRSNEDEIDDADVDDLTTLSSIDPESNPGGYRWFKEFGFFEHLLVFVGGICLLVLALSVVYFYVVRKLGWFSDNPWYKRRTYYAMTHASVRDPSRSFNLYIRERPNTLSLSAHVTTPPKVIIPVPMRDVAVGDDDKITDKKVKRDHKGKSKIHKSESIVHKNHASSNAVGPILLTASPNPSWAKSSTRKHHHHHNHQKKKSISKYAVHQTIHHESSDEESAVYITPPQDPIQKTKEKSSASANRSRKK